MIMGERVSKDLESPNWFQVSRISSIPINPYLALVVESSQV